MRKSYDLSVKIGEYQKDGQTKNRYVKVGAVMMGDNGPFILLERTFNPAGVPNPENKTSCLVSMFKADENFQASQNAVQSAVGAQNPPQDRQSLAQRVFNDQEIPF